MPMCGLLHWWRGCGMWIDVLRNNVLRLYMDIPIQQRPKAIPRVLPCFLTSYGTLQSYIARLCTPIPFSLFVVIDCGQLYAIRWKLELDHTRLSYGSSGHHPFSFVVLSLYCRDLILTCSCSPRTIQSWTYATSQENGMIQSLINCPLLNPSLIFHWHNSLYLTHFLFALSQNIMDNDDHVLSWYITCWMVVGRSGSSISSFVYPTTE